MWTIILTTFAFIGGALIPVEFTVSEGRWQTDHRCNAFIESVSPGVTPVDGVWLVEDTDGRVFTAECVKTDSIK